MCCKVDGREYLAIVRSFMTPRSACYCILKGRVHVPAPANGSKPFYGNLQNTFGPYLLNIVQLYRNCQRVSHVSHTNPLLHTLPRIPDAEHGALQLVHPILLLGVGVGTCEVVHKQCIG
jgi:hypothetical protein